MNRLNHRTALAAAAVALTAAALVPIAAHADTLTLVSDDTDWRQSTTVLTTNADTEPWPGVLVADIPSLDTFTEVPTAQDTAANSITGATELFSGSGVRFFRTTFTLPQLTDLSVTLRTSVDNSIHIFVNRVELALYGPLDGFGGDALGLGIATDGTVTNGGVDARPFSEVAPTFTSFQPGTNELLLAVRNLNGGDQGGFAFRADLNFTPAATTVPEAGTLALALPALAMVGTVLVRRRKK